MKYVRPLSELVEDFYKNSPDWPFSRPQNLDEDVEAFCQDGEFNVVDVRRAIEKFWQKIEKAQVQHE